MIRCVCDQVLDTIITGLPHADRKKYPQSARAEDPPWAELCAKILERYHRLRIGYLLDGRDQNGPGDHGLRAVCNLDWLLSLVCSSRCAVQDINLEFVAAWHDGQAVGNLKRLESPIASRSYRI